MKKLIKKIIQIITITFLGMYGGQKKKATRRFGIPFFSFFIKLKELKLKSLAFLLLIPILCMGYGVNSFLMNILNNDTLVRIVYGALLSLPFMFFGIRKWLISLISLVIAFNIRAGCLFTIGDFDLLWEDFVRYSTLGILIVFLIYSEKNGGK